MSMHQEGVLLWRTRFTPSCGIGFGSWITESNVLPSALRLMAPLGFRSPELHLGMIWQYPGAFQLWIVMDF